VGGGGWQGVGFGLKTESSSNPKKSKTVGPQEEQKSFYPGIGSVSKKTKSAVDIKERERTKRAFMGRGNLFCSMPGGDCYVEKG